MRKSLEEKIARHETKIEDVSQVLLCYSLRVSLQPSPPNVIEGHHASPDPALSSRSRDRHRPSWPAPARPATVPLPRAPLGRSPLSAGLACPGARAGGQSATRRAGPPGQWDA